MKEEPKLGLKSFGGG